MDAEQPERSERAVAPAASDQPAPNDHREGLDYSRLYEYRFKDVDQDARQRVWNEIARYLWERMGRPRRVLDPAGGRGEFVNAVPAEERWLIDVVDYPERNTDPAVRIVIGDLFDLELPDAYFDAVFASNLLEHFRSPEDVARFLDRMRATLTPGGVLALMGPNYKYCADEYFDCADHLLALTHVSVQEHLFAAGYRVREVVPRFLPFSFRSRLPASPALTRLYLRMPALWRLQGKQFLILATP
jgi:ubiquinone/menaquinone biosynthesis C-methylase UbiE